MQETLLPTRICWVTANAPYHCLPVLCPAKSHQLAFCGCAETVHNHYILIRLAEMCSLPESLVLIQLKFLDPHTLLCEAPVVCKLWNALVYVSASRFAPVLPNNMTERSAWRQRVVRWLQRSKALKVFRYREHMALPPDSISDDQVKSLCLAIGQLPDLEELYMSCCRLSHTGLYPLKDLTTLSQLQVLSLDHCGLQDPDLVNLAPLTSLRHLDLSGNSFSFTSGSFSSLTGALHQLTSLKLHNAASVWLQDPHLDQLANFSQLQALDMSRCRANLAHLPKFPSLTKLVANVNAVTATPGSLSRLSNLQHLQIDHCFFTEATQDFSALARLTCLEASNFTIDAPDQRGVFLTALAPLTQLRHLAIDPVVDWDTPTSSFSLLATLKHLTHLELCGTQLPSGLLSIMFEPAAAGAAAAGEAGAAAAGEVGAGAAGAAATAPAGAAGAAAGAAADAVPDHPADAGAPAAASAGSGCSSSAGGGAALPNLKYFSIVWHCHPEEYQVDWAWEWRDDAMGSDQLQQLVRNCPSLEVLTIKNYPVQVAGVAHLTALTGLRELELSDVYYPLGEPSEMSPKP